MYGGKDVENRTQAWSYRGPLAIHAGARWSDRGGHSRLVARAFVRDRQAMGIRGVVKDMDRLLIGVVDLVDAHTAEPGCCESPWAETAYDEHGGKTRRDIVHLVPARSTSADPASGATPGRRHDTSWRPCGRPCLTTWTTRPPRA